jgi:nitrite reductase/ring-hydroxylating ferredoxin subunit
MARVASPICRSAVVTELGSHGFGIFYRGVQRDAILVRYRGVAYGYLNQCVHMPRRLDGEEPYVFDGAGSAIRCTMHGITYRPETGECLSEICSGQSLTPLRIEEHDGVVYLTDKRTVIAD